MKTLTWKEDIPVNHPHVKAYMEEFEPGFIVDDYSETYLGDTATRVEFENGWGYETVLIVTPDYWRWAISIFDPTGFHFDEAGSFEDALAIINKETN